MNHKFLAMYDWELILHESAEGLDLLKPSDRVTFDCRLKAAIAKNEDMDERERDHLEAMVRSARRLLATHLEKMLAMRFQAQTIPMMFGEQTGIEL